MIYISDVMYWISTGLLVPVVILLIYFFVRALILVGSFFGQYLAMKRTQRFVNSHLDRLTPDNLDDFVKSLPDNCNALLNIFHDLFQAAEDGKTAVVRILSIEYVKSYFCILILIPKIAVAHGHFIKIHHHG